MMSRANARPRCGSLGGGCGAKEAILPLTGASRKTSANALLELPIQKLTRAAYGDERDGCDGRNRNRPRKRGTPCRDLDSSDDWYRRLWLHAQRRFILRQDLK